MKYLKHYKLFETHYTDKILYHGGLEGFYDEETGKNMFNKFKTFAKRTAYFADNPNFAIDYAEMKSMDGGYDADIYLYTCHFTGNLFEYNNKEDIDKLIPLIPEEVDIRHDTYWFLTGKIPKKEFIKNLQGIITIEPIPQFVNAKIGERVKYDSDTQIIVDRDDKYVYSIKQDTFNSYKNSSSMGYNEHFSNYTKYKDIFEPWRNAIVDAYNRNTGRNHSYPKYSTFNRFYHTYEYAKKGYNIDYVAYNDRNDKELFTKDEITKIDSLYNDCLKKFEETAYKELDRNKWVINEEERPMGSNWNYYETSIIRQLIIELGYDGYVALEKKHKTYAIYNPHETIEIIKTERIR